MVKHLVRRLLRLQKDMGLIPVRVILKTLKWYLKVVSGPIRRQYNVTGYMQGSNYPLRRAGKKYRSLYIDTVNILRALRQI